MINKDGIFSSFASLFGHAKKPEPERTPEELAALKGEIARRNEEVQKMIDQLNNIFSGKLVKFAYTRNGACSWIDVCEDIRAEVWQPFDQLNGRYVHIAFANHPEETLVLGSFTTDSIIEDEAYTRAKGGGCTLRLVVNDTMTQAFREAMQELNQYLAATEAGEASKADLVSFAKGLARMRKLNKGIFGKWD